MADYSRDQYGHLFDKVYGHNVVFTTKTDPLAQEKFDFFDAIEMEPVVEDGIEVWKMVDNRDWFN